MSESKDEQIARLLREGLDYYGGDEVSKAIVSWLKVLELDPDNVEAFDYIQTADRRSAPRPVKQKVVRDARHDAARAILREAEELIEREEFEQALDLLRSSAEGGVVSLELETTVELMRSRLLGRYRSRIGALDCAPVLCADPSALKRFNLPPGAGFVLSMVDGATSITDLISLSGMDAFETLRTVSGLVEAGIVEIRQ